MCYMDELVKRLEHAGLHPMVAVVLSLMIWISMLCIDIGIGIAVFCACVLSLFEGRYLWFIGLAVAFSLLISVLIALMIAFDEEFYEENCIK